MASSAPMARRRPVSTTARMWEEGPPVSAKGVSRATLCAILSGKTDAVSRPPHTSSWSLSYNLLTGSWRKSHDTDVDYMMAAKKDR
jgi:hypothetical protein